MIFGAAAERIELAEGIARIKDNPEAALPFMACGAIINANNAGLPADLDDDAQLPLRLPAAVRDAGRERKFGNLTLTYATQIHACVVEIDPETGDNEVVDYAAVDDCGTRIHPQIVEGQVQGATAQALGAALRRSSPTTRTATCSRRTSTTTTCRTRSTCRRSGRLHRGAVALHAARHEGDGRGRGAGIHAVCAAIQDALRGHGGAIVCDSHNPYHRVWELLQKPDETRALVEVDERMNIEGTARSPLRARRSGAC